MINCLPISFKHTTPINHNNTLSQIVFFFFNFPQCHSPRKERNSSWFLRLPNASTKEGQIALGAKTLEYDLTSNLLTSFVQKASNKQSLSSPLPSTTITDKGSGSQPCTFLFG